MKRKMSITSTAVLGALVVAVLVSRPFASVAPAATSEAAVPATTPDTISTEFEIQAGETKSILQGGTGTNIRVFLLCQGSGGDLELNTGSEKRFIGSSGLTGTYADLGAGSTLKATVTGTGGKFTVKVLNLLAKP